MSKPSDFKDFSFKPTIFNKIENEIKTSGVDPEAIIQLHVGDTWFDLPGELDSPIGPEPWADRLSRYGATQGDLELRTRLARKILERNRIPVNGPREIQITFGATGALFLAMQRIVRDSNSGPDQENEVLTLSPYWTILRVVAATAGVKLVEVPVFDRLSENPEETDFKTVLEPYLTDRTVAVYFNSPNNPAGVMLRAKHLEAIARFAQENDLWVLSDEAYEDFVWVDEPYLSIGSLPGMFERTVSVFSMSKSYAAAGLRLGCIAAPASVIAALNPVHVGVGYEPNRDAQVKWIRGLERQEEITVRLRDAYLEGREAAMNNLELDYLRPEGSFYLFLDLRERWAGMSYDEKIRRMVKAGIVLSPGEAFGTDYDGWGRFCYTSEPPEIIAEGARRTRNL